MGVIVSHAVRQCDRHGQSPRWTSILSLAFLPGPHTGIIDSTAIFAEFCASLAQARSDEYPVGNGGQAEAKCVAEARLALPRFGRCRLGRCCG